MLLGKIPLKIQLFLLKNEKNDFFFFKSIANSIITCMMGDVVRSKPWLGFLGNLSAIMATLASFGFAMYMDIEFIGLNLAAPFLMIGS